MAFKPTPDHAFAIQIPIGTIVVSAGAGTGKTSVLAETVAHEMIANKNISVDKLLVLTFTRKAAGEMAERIEHRLIELSSLESDPDQKSRLLRESANVVNASIETLDAFAGRILREYGGPYGIDPEFDVIDQDEYTELGEKVARACLEKWNENPPHPDWIDFISNTRITDWHKALIDIINITGSRGDLSPSLLLLGTHDEKLNSIESALDALTARTENEYRALLSELKSGLDQFESDLRETSEEPTKAQYAGKAADILSELPDLKKWFDQEYQDWQDPIINKIENWKIWSKAKNESEPRKSSRLFARFLQKHIADKLQFDDPDKLTLKSLHLEISLLSYKHAIAEAILRFNSEFRAARVQKSVLSFADTEIEAFTLIANNPAIQNALRARYDYIVVDEFQDINPLQRDFIFSVSKPDPENPGLPKNLYIVGDERQSIYGFRNADNRIICDLRTKASEIDTENSGSKILHDSFRSRPEILNLVNHAFRHIWSETGIHTDLRACSDLYKSAEDLPAEGKIELHIASSEDSKTGKLIESGVIAARLHEIVKIEQPEIWHRIDGKPHSRKISWGDCVVLCRKRKEFAAFEESFDSWGIPYTTEGGGGFWDRTEISDIRALVSSLSERATDLDIAILLRSPWVGLSDDSLVEIAGALSKENSWLEIIRDIKLSTLDDSEKLEHFNSWRSKLDPYAGRVHVSRFIEKALELSGYREKVFANSKPDQVNANIEKLLETLRGRKNLISLGESSEYLDFLKDRDSQVSSISATGTSSDTVTIATVHKSKGLEWPLVVLPNIARQLISRGNTENISWSDSNGLIFRWTDPLTGASLNPSSVIKSTDSAKEFDQGEELRLLYVAITRARERLILSSPLKPKLEKNEWSMPDSWLKTLSESFGDITSLAGSPDSDVDSNLSFVVADSTAPESVEAGKPLLISRKIHAGMPAVEKSRELDIAHEDLEKTFLKALDNLPEIPPAGSSRYIISATEIAAFSSCPKMYGYRAVMGTPSIRTEFRQVAAEFYNPDSENPGPPAPSTEHFELSASKWGTIIHEILENIDFDSNSAKIDKTIREHLQKYEIDPNSTLPENLASDKNSKLTFIEILTNIISSTLALPVFDEIRSLDSKYVLKEFRLLACMDDPDEVIHGTIDLLAITPEKILVIDYKSGKVENPDKYLTQLAIYTYLASERYGLPVSKIDPKIISLNPPTVHDLKITDQTIDSIKSLLARIRESSQARVFEAAPDDFTCRFCDYRDICDKSLYNTQSPT